MPKPRAFEIDPVRWIFDRVRLDDETGCWVWHRSLNGRGYGRANPGGRTEGLAHRLVWETLVGEITEETLDHLCLNIACVRPRHLEPASRRENTRRQLERLHGETCQRGHAWTPENAYVRPDTGHRQCRACIAIRNPKVPPVTECPKGHPYDEANTYRNKVTGHRSCKACAHERYLTSKPARPYPFHNGSDEARMRAMLEWTG